MRADQNVKKFQDYQVWAIQDAATEAEYNAAMEDLKKTSPTAYEYLKRKTPQKWCKWPFMKSLSMFGHRTSNFVESGNSMILEARNMSAFKATQHIIHQVMIQISERRVKADKRYKAGEEYTKFAAEKIAVNKRAAKFQRVSVSSPELAYVQLIGDPNAPWRTVYNARMNCLINPATNLPVDP